MGTFPMTCGLSGLPIERGDDVVVFLTVCNWKDNDTGLNGRVHARGFAAPWTLPLYGTYTGAGYPDLDDNYNKELVETRLDIGNWEFSLGVDSNDDPMKTGWPAFWTEMHRDELWFEGEERRFGIGLLMIRRDIIDRFVGEFPTEYRHIDNAHLDFLRGDTEEVPDTTSLFVPSQIMAGVAISPLTDHWDIPEAKQLSFMTSTRPHLDESDVVLDFLGDMYGLIERHRDELEGGVWEQFIHDKILFSLVGLLISELGRDWIQPPNTVEQFPDWTRRVSLLGMVFQQALDLEEERRDD